MRATTTLKTSLFGIVAVTVLAGAMWAGDEPEQKSDLKILYAGNPSSPRTDDFVKFLGTYLRSVQSTDLETLTEAQTGRFDVVLLGHDAEEPPCPEFSDEYAVPTVTLGVTGAWIGYTNGLKTGYS